MGVFDKSEDAYKRGIELKGNVPMVISKVEEAETVQYIPAMVLGLMNAHRQ